MIRPGLDEQNENDEEGRPGERGRGWYDVQDGVEILKS